MKMDYKDFIPSTALKKYRKIDNVDGTISLEDVTTYSQVGDRFGANDINEIAKSCIQTLTHSKSGTTHSLNGDVVTSGLQTIKFKATADFVQGDIFNINAIPYVIQPNKEPLNDVFKVGTVVSVELDITGKTINFKSAGGVKLPAGTMAIYKIFTANGTFVAPKTGKYRFTCIGKGGNGGISNTNSSGGGGGTGGVSCCVFTANTGHTLSITVDSGKSAVGIIMAATAGENGAANGGQGAGGYGTGGSTYNITGGGGNGFYGGCYSTAAAASCKYISETYAGFDYTPDSYTHGRTLTKPNANGLIPYGNGGSGGKQYVDPDQNATHGGIGSPGAVIIEMELNA